MSSSNRRDFLKQSTAGAAAASLTATGLMPRRTFGAELSKFERVAYRELGSTGFKASEIGFGCMNMRDPELVHAAIDRGINYIDTAHSYMNGVNEDVVGKVMKTKRDKVFLATKVKWTDPKQMPKMMETSLKRLQTDHVDIMFMHILNKRKDVLNDDFIKMFDDAKKRGLCKYVGVTTHSNQGEVLDAATDSKFWDAVLVGYNAMSPPSVGTAIGRARNAGIATIAMKIILNPATNPWTPVDDIRKDKNSKISQAQALIKWVLDDRFVDTTIPGMTSFEQLNENFALMGMPMSFGERRSIMRLGETMRGSYCSGVAGCTGCVDQCPNGVCVNDINRCLMYAGGYGDIDLARENYDDLPESSKLAVCADCDECTVECVNGLDLVQNIKRAKELFA
ncbi:aldo/keto reductase [Candidatus Latescibacterota bacterium]